uniref:Uncharacterized protein n=1 Tax=Oryza glaberrima TaxID=4538 RepID=I1PRU2_ORYGL
MPVPLHRPGRGVAGGGDGGGCGGDEVGNEGGGLRRVPRRRPSSRTSPPRGRRVARQLYAVPVTPSSMAPATRTARCTFRSAPLGRSGRLAAGDGGG